MITIEDYDDFFTAEIESEEDLENFIKLMENNKEEKMKPLCDYVNVDCSCCLYACGSEVCECQSLSKEEIIEDVEKHITLYTNVLKQLKEKQ